MGRNAQLGQDSHISKMIKQTLLSSSNLRVRVAVMI